MMIVQDQEGYNPEDDIMVTDDICEDMDMTVGEDGDCVELAEPDDDFDVMFKSRANKHKLDGKHTLKKDTIFNFENNEDDGGLEESTSNFEESRSVMQHELKFDDDYIHDKELSEDVNKILSEMTDMDFTQNRRKPNKETFNGYYQMCYDNLKTKYSKSEVFVELSYYFTDNTFNMFKLLNKQNATGIIRELKYKGFLTDIGSINFI